MSDGRDCWRRVPYFLNKCSRQAYIIPLYSPCTKATWPSFQDLLTVYSCKLQIGSWPNFQDKCTRFILFIPPSQQTATCLAKFLQQVYENLQQTDTWPSSEDRCTTKAKFCTSMNFAQGLTFAGGVYKVDRHVVVWGDEFRPHVVFWELLSKFPSLIIRRDSLQRHSSWSYANQLQLPLVMVGAKRKTKCFAL